MNDFLSRITPHTAGIIWLPNGDIDSFNPHYSAIDYLLDGLLTAHLQDYPELSSRVIIGQNFSKPFYVMIIKKFVLAEVESFQALIKESLQTDTYIVVIDEPGEFSKLEKAASKLKPHLRFLQ